MAHWIIETSDDTPHYVSRIPDIQFHRDTDFAVKMDIAQVILTMRMLAEMQRLSSYQTPDSYTMIHIKD